MTRAAIENTSTLYARPHLTVSNTSLKIEFNPVIIGIPEFLDSGRWPLDADFKDGPDIMLSELACFSETKNNLIILQTKNRADSFFITGKYHRKKQNITSHLKAFLKRATH